MIDDVDRTLERLLRARVPLPADQYDVNFELPSSDWMKRLSAGRRTVNVYLYDVRENTQLRSTEWRHERRPDGSLAKKRPRARLDLFYVVTTWSSATPPDPFDEHRLLGQVLRTLLRYPTLPAETLQGVLVGQEPPLPAMTAQPDGLRSPWELWSALGNRLRPSLHLVVTVAVDPAGYPDVPEILAPVVSRRMEVSGGLRHAVRATLGRPLAADVPAGVEVRAVRPASATTAKTARAIYGSADVVRVVDGALLAANEWYVVEDGTASEGFLLRAAPGAGPVTVPVQPPLRSGHAAGRALRRATPAGVVLTATSAAASAGGASLPLASGAGVAAGEWLLVEDGERAELVLPTAAGTAGPRSVALRSPLRHAHPAGTPVRQVTLGAAETTLEDAANRPAATVLLASRAAVDAGDLATGTAVMVGAGAAAEVVTLGTIPAAPSRTIPVSPPLTGSWPSGTALRVLADVEPLGEVAAPARAGTSDLLVAGEGSARLSAGAVVRIGSGPPAHGLVTATAPATVSAGGEETLYRLEGTVVEEAGSAPVAGARVVLAELSLAAVTAADGRFFFSNLGPGDYTLRAAAAGYAEQGRTVRVPGRATDEYTLRVSPA